MGCGLFLDPEFSYGGFYAKHARELDYEVIQIQRQKEALASIDADGLGSHCRAFWRLGDQDPIHAAAFLIDHEKVGTGVSAGTRRPMERSRCSRQ